MTIKILTQGKMLYLCKNALSAKTVIAVVYLTMSHYGTFEKH